MTFLQAVAEFEATHRRSNPRAAPSSTEFIRFLIAEDFDFSELGEEEWRGMGEELGMNDAQIFNLLENASSYME
jgi:hypothetical protein